MSDPALLNTSAITNLLVWREVLIPYFQDDGIVVKLWCSTPAMQKLLTANLKHLTCHIRLAVTKKDRYIHPSFLSALTSLKSLTFTRSKGYVRKYPQYGTPFTQPCCPTPNWDIIPESVELLNIFGLDEIIVLSNTSIVELTNLLWRRPSLRLAPHSHDHHSYSTNYKRLLDRMMMNISWNFKSIALLRFPSLSMPELKGMLEQFEFLPQDVCNWLMIHWFPYIVNLTVGSFDSPRVVQWACKFFPNLNALDNTGILPHHLKSYSCDFYPKQCTVSDLLTKVPYLTSLDIRCTLEGDQLPYCLPSTLQHLAIDISSNVRQEQMRSFICQNDFPALTSLDIRTSIYKQWEWKLDMLANLPCGLKRFVDSNFPADLKLWRLLPSKLTDIYTKHCSYGNDNYQVVSPYLTKLHVTIMESDNMPNSSIPLKLSTLTRFQELVELNLTIIDNYIVEGFSEFPSTIKRLKIKLTSHNWLHGASGRIMEDLPLPSKLKYFTLQGDFTVCDGQVWPLFPDTIRQITFSKIYFKSLPNIWPKSLHMLIFKQCGNIPPVSFMDKLHHLCSKEEIHSIPNFIESMKALSSTCLIVNKYRPFELLYLEVDGNNNTVDGKDIKELDKDANKEVGDLMKITSIQQHFYDEHQPLDEYHSLNGQLY